MPSEAALKGCFPASLLPCFAGSREAGKQGSNPSVVVASPQLQLTKQPLGHKARDKSGLKLSPADNVIMARDQPMETSSCVA